MPHYQAIFAAGNLLPILYILCMTIEIREAKPEEYAAIGALTVRVYQQLPDMPQPDVMPEYYTLLADVKARITDKSVKVIVACADDGTLLGSVMYYDDMKFYGSDGAATLEKNASGIRLLAVDFPARGQGIGRKLTEHCINLSKHPQIILHTTIFMQQAWKMYEKMGFERSPDLDFIQGPVSVFGFRKKRA